MYYEDQLIKYKHNTKMIWKTLNQYFEQKKQKKQIYQNSSLIICHLTS